MNSKDLFTFILCVVLCEFAGVIGSFFTMPSVGSWYASLVKPLWAPPNWVFAPVWITLYALMGASLYLILRSRENRVALGFFSFQLFLNVVWSYLFFGLHNVGLAAFELLILWVFIDLTIYWAYKVDKKAAWLLVPYIVWVSVAAILNFSIWVLNV